MTQTHEEWFAGLIPGAEVEVMYGGLGWMRVTVVECHPERVTVPDMRWGDGSECYALRAYVRPIQSEPAKVEEAPASFPQTTEEAAKSLDDRDAMVSRLAALESEVASLRAELASLRPQPVESDRGAGLLTVNDSITRRHGR